MFNVYRFIHTVHIIYTYMYIVDINQPQAAGILLILLHIKYFNEQNIIPI